MYKKTVTYEDFNGDAVTEDLYFNMSKDDLIKLIRDEPDFADNLQAAFDRQDGPAIFDGIRTLILKSYGIKSADGRSFSRKVDGVLLSETFEDTAAYSKIMDDMLDNLDDGAAFFTGIFPQDLMAQAKAAMEKNEKKDINQLELPKNDEPASFGLVSTEPGIDDVPQELAVQMDTEVTPIIPAHPEIVSDPVGVPDAPDFAKMTPQEFDHWRRTNT